MIDWLMHFALKLLETCRDILPIVVIIIGFQLLVIRKPLAHPKKTIIGFFYVLLGIVFFSRGTGFSLVSAWQFDGVAVDHPGVFGC